MSAGAEAPTIAHVAQIELSPDSGMGRVAWHWRRALAERGYSLVHIGPAEIGRPVHPAVFPWAAWHCYRRLRPRPVAVLVHEPSGAPFVLAQPRTIAFSHGLERRGWNAHVAQATAEGRPVRVRSRLLFPLWRLAPADFTLRRARAVLVLNRDDLAFVQEHYGRRREDVFLFRNGVEETTERQAPPPGATAAATTVLFVGTWLARKGTGTLVAAAQILAERGIAPRFLLAGTGLDEAAVLAAWPEALRPRVTVLPRFAAGEEAAVFSRGEVFVLPSHFEGQPLALLQAMASGLCCIAAEASGARDLVAHGRTGLLHPPGDAARLAEEIARCLADPALRWELGRAARQAVAGRTWETVAGEVADFLVGLVERPFAPHLLETPR